MDNSVVIEPWLTVPDSRKAIDFYKSAFDTTESYLMEGEGDDLVAKLNVGGAGFWIANGPTESNGMGNVRMILIVQDPDSFFKNAIAAGAVQVNPVADEYGWRVGRLKDPFGFHWEIGHPLEP